MTELFEPRKILGMDVSSGSDRTCYILVEITVDGLYICKPFKPYLIVDNTKEPSK